MCALLVRFGPFHHQLSLYVRRILNMLTQNVQVKPTCRNVYGGRFSFLHIRGLVSQIS